MIFNNQHRNFWWTLPSLLLQHDSFGIRFRRLIYNSETNVSRDRTNWSI